MFQCLNIVFAQESKLFRQDTKTSEQLNYLVQTTLYLVRTRHVVRMNSDNLIACFAQDNYVVQMT